MIKALPTTAIPNVFLDILPNFSDAELRLMLVFYRHPGKQLSILHLSDLTGMSHQGILNATKSLLANRIVKRKPSGNSYAYTIAEGR